MLPVTGAYGFVKKALYKPPDNTIPEFLIAIKMLQNTNAETDREALLKEASVTAQFDHRESCVC